MSVGRVQLDPLQLQLASQPLKPGVDGNLLNLHTFMVVSFSYQIDV